MTSILRHLHSVVSLAIITTCLLMNPFNGLDLEVYRFGAGILAENSADLYLGSVAESNLPFTYPPFAALIFRPFYMVGSRFAIALMASLSLLAIATFCFSFSKFLAMSIHVTAINRWLITGPTVGAVILPLAAYNDTLDFGQVNILIFVCCFLAIRRWGWTLPAGVVIGICAAVKLTPLFFVIVFVMVRSKAGLAGLALGFLGPTAISWLFYPKASADFWFSAIMDPNRVGTIAFVDNTSVLGVFTRLLGGQQHFLWIGLVLALITALAAILFLKCPLDEVAQLGIASSVMLVASPITWTHHWVWLPVICYSYFAIGRLLPPTLRICSYLMVVALYAVGIGSIKRTYSLLGLNPRFETVGFLDVFAAFPAVLVTLLLFLGLIAACWPRHQLRVRG